jgi:hypothetical protein
MVVLSEKYTTKNTTLSAFFVSASPERNNREMHNAQSSILYDPNIFSSVGAAKSNKSERILEILKHRPTVPFVI